jgi:hypothetical protein
VISADPGVAGEQLAPALHVTFNVAGARGRSLKVKVALR